MKLSENMLNFLGWMTEQPTLQGGEPFCAKEMAIALAYPFGVKAAIKAGLMIEHEKIVEIHPALVAVFPDRARRHPISGYMLTELGVVIGGFGRKMRRAPIQQFNEIINEAQAELDTRLEAQTA